MMPQIKLRDNQPSHKFKLCNNCKASKPPEGGIDMGTKWHCQACWTRQITGRTGRK